MKKWFQPGFRYPSTLLVHGFLLGIVKFTVHDYHDVILWAAGLLLTTHLIWSICLVRKGTPPLPIGITHAICTVLQILVVGRMEDQAGLGAGFALFFYQIMLVVFLILMLFSLPIAYATRKGPK